MFLKASVLLTGLNQGIELVTKAFKALEKVTVGMLDQFEDLGRRLAPFSGGLSQAFAQGEVSRINTLQRVNAESGEVFARMIRIQTDLQNTGLELKAAVLNIIAPALEVMAKVLKGLLKVVQAMATPLIKVANKILAWFGMGGPGGGPHDAMERQLERFFGRR